jgi:hypothetical protein
MEILHISVVEALARIDTEKGQASVFLRTSGELTRSLGERTFMELRRLLPMHLVGVELRNDEWFIGSPAFPVVYPFASPGEPPSADEYRRSKTLHCGKSGDSIRCVGADD